MIIAANWKMNLNTDGANNLLQNYITAFATEPYLGHEMIVIGSTISLQSLVDLTADSKLQVYAQDVSKFPGFGSYTGETSAEQLKSIGVKGVLIGHMERRTLLKEAEADINFKIKNALNAGLKVILSVGETTVGLDETQQQKLIQSQLENDLEELTTHQIQDNLLIAYETVATVSSFGNLAVGAQLPVQNICNKAMGIKKFLTVKYPDINIPIIYGGSVAAENIGQFATNHDFNFAGFLVGKKSLNIEEFKALIAAI